MSNLDNVNSAYDHFSKCFNEVARILKLFYQLSGKNQCKSVHWTYWEVYRPPKKHFSFPDVTSTPIDSISLNSYCIFLSAARSDQI
jgi:hypothetical protein